MRKTVASHEGGSAAPLERIAVWIMSYLVTTIAQSYPNLGFPTALVVFYD